MKCQILFSGKNKKNIINLSSAENAQRVVKIKLPLDIIGRLYSVIMVLPRHFHYSVFSNTVIP